MPHHDAVPCPDCAGRGRLKTDPLVLVYRRDLGAWDLPECPTCAGHGTVAASLAELRRRIIAEEQAALATLPDPE
jgi:DnaJ-class molecular chaperone